MASWLRLNCQVMGRVLCLVIGLKLIIEYEADDDRDNIDSDVLSTCLYIVEGLSL
jgi:hypothetical protein